MKKRLFAVTATLVLTLGVPGLAGAANNGQVQLSPSEDGTITKQEAREKVREIVKEHRNVDLSKLDVNVEKAKLDVAAGEAVAYEFEGDGSGGFEVVDKPGNLANPTSHGAGGAASCYSVSPVSQGFWNDAGFNVAGVNGCAYDFHTQGIEGGYVLGAGSGGAFLVDALNYDFPLFTDSDNLDYWAIACFDGTAGAGLDDTPGFADSTTTVGTMVCFEFTFKDDPPSQWDGWDSLHVNIQDAGPLASCLDSADRSPDARNLRCTQAALGI